MKKFAVIAILVMSVAGVQTAAASSKPDGMAGTSATGKNKKPCTNRGSVLCKPRAGTWSGVVVRDNKEEANQGADEEL